jgi:hypothetical protein
MDRTNQRPGIFTGHFIGCEEETPANQTKSGQNGVKIAKTSSHPCSKHGLKNKLEKCLQHSYLKSVFLSNILGDCQTLFISKKLTSAKT